MNYMSMLFADRAFRLVCNFHALYSVYTVRTAHRSKFNAANYFWNIVYFNK